jgi:hypothetical protein
LTPHTIINFVVFWLAHLISTATLRSHTHNCDTAIAHTQRRHCDRTHTTAMKHKELKLTFVKYNFQYFTTAHWSFTVRIKPSAYIYSTINPYIFTCTCCLYSHRESNCFRKVSNWLSPHQNIIRVAYLIHFTNFSNIFRGPGLLQTCFGDLICCRLPVGTINYNKVKNALVKSVSWGHGV